MTKRTTTASAKRRTSKTATPANSTRGQANRTSSAKRKAAAKTGGKQTTRAQRGEAPPSAGNAGLVPANSRQEAKRPQGRAAPPLRPIRKRESVSQLIAAAAADAGVDQRTGAVFNRSLMDRLKRHVMRGGSGYVAIPNLDAALWRGRTAAQKARKLASPILGGRIVSIPQKPAHPTPRFRAYRPLRDIVARI